MAGESETAKAGEVTRDLECHTICPWWGGYFIGNRFRRWLHNPERILTPYVEPDMTVLDFGCGMSILSIAVVRMVGDEGQVIAVDVQQQMLDVLSKRAAGAGVVQRIRCHLCSVDLLNFDEPVDFALAFYSPHEVRTFAGYLKAFMSLCARRARLLWWSRLGM